MFRAQKQFFSRVNFIKKQYYAGLTHIFVERVSAENWIIDWERMKSPGNIEMQFTLNVTYLKLVRT